MYVINRESYSNDSREAKLSLSMQFREIDLTFGFTNLFFSVSGPPPEFVHASIISFFSRNFEDIEGNNSQISIKNIIIPSVIYK